MNLHNREWGNCRLCFVRVLTRGFFNYILTIFVFYVSQWGDGSQVFYCYYFCALLRKLCYTSRLHVTGLMKTIHSIHSTIIKILLKVLAFLRILSTSYGWKWIINVSYFSKNQFWTYDIPARFIYIMYIYNHVWLSPI